jgi:hypothetical protein
MKLLDHLLFIYSSLFALAITVAAVINRQGGSQTVIIVTLFLPITLYLIYQTLITLYRRKYTPVITSTDKSAPPTKPKLVNLPQKGFFRQKSLAFLITLTLFIATFTAIITLAIISPAPTTHATNTINN